MKSVSLLLFAATVTAFTTSFGCNALHSDEAGLFDTTISLIGRPLASQFHIADGFKAAIILSEKNVVAAVRVKNGDIAWRHKLNHGADVKNLNSHAGATTVSSARGLTVVQSSDGSVLLDKTGLDLEDRIGAVAVPCADGKACVVALTSSSGLMCLASSGKNGMKSLRLPEGVSVVKSIQPASNGKVFVLATGATTTSVLTIDAEACSLTNSQSTASENNGHCKDVSLSPNGALWCIKSGSAVKFWAPNSLAGSGKVLDVKAEVGLTEFTWARESQAAVKLSDGSHAVISIVNSEVAVKKFGSEAPRVASWGKQSAAVKFECKNGSSRIVAISDTGKEQSISFELGGNRGCVQNVFAHGSMRKRDDGVTFRALAVDASNRFSLVEHGGVRWSREEGLAYPNDILAFHDEDLLLPHHTPTVWDSFVALGGWAAQYAEPFIGGPQHHMSHVDANALILVASTTGYIFALERQTGNVRWASSLGDSKIAFPVPRKLILTRKLGSSPEVLVLGHASASPQAPSFVATLNARNGEITSTSKLNSRLEVFEQLPLADDSNRQPVVAMDSNMRVYVFPASKGAERLVSQNSGKIILHRRSESEMQAYAVDAVSSNNGIKLSSRPLWNYVAPQGARILKHASMPADPVAWAGIPLEAGRVLFKYINPNAIALLLESQESTVLMHILDGASGSVVHAVEHAESERPSCLALSQSSVTYAFWNSRQHRQEVVFADMATDSPTSWSPIAVFKLLTGRIQYNENPGVHFRPLTFVSNFGISNCAMTRSKLGITTQNPMYELTGGQLVSLPRRYVESLRPVGQPTASEKEKGYEQYHPVLPIHPTQMVTYNQTLLDTKDILTFPEHRESGCLAVVTGLDLFWAQTSPAKHFDSLKHDFSKGALLIATVGLGFVNFALKLFVDKADLKAVWA